MFLLKRKKCTLRKGRTQTHHSFQMHDMPAPDDFPLADVSYNRIMATVLEHCHPDRGSNPAGLTEDVQAIAEFFNADDLSVIATALQRRNLTIRIEKPNST